MEAERLFYHVKDLCEQEIFVPTIYFKNSTELLVYDYHVAEISKTKVMEGLKTDA